MAAVRSMVLRVVIDFMSIFLAYLPWIVLNTMNRPFHRGFFCDDESLSHPYKPSTVPTSYVMGFGITIMIVLVVVCESFHLYACKQKHQASPEPYRISGLNFAIHPLIIMIYKHLVTFAFGAFAQQTVTAIGKFSCGRLRPHFFDGCRPDFSQFNCTGNDGLPAYVTNFECTGTDQKVLDDIRLSFPSGHSSLATYFGVYIALYLQARLTWRGSWLLKHFLSALFVYLALFVCMSRISDYKHHWSDVIAGAFIGTVGAILTAVFIAKLFKRKWFRYRWKSGRVSRDMDMSPRSTDGIATDQQGSNA